MTEELFFKVLPKELLVNIYSYAGLFDGNDCIPPIEHVIIIDDLFKDQLPKRSSHALMNEINLPIEKYSIIKSYLFREHLGSFNLFSYKQPLRVAYLHLIGLVGDNIYDKFVAAYKASVGKSCYIFYKYMHTFIDQSVLVLNPTISTNSWRDTNTKGEQYKFDTLQETVYAYYIGLINDKNMIIDAVNDCRYSIDIINSLNLHKTFIGGIKYNDHPSEGTSDIQYKAPRSCLVSEFYTSRAELYDDVLDIIIENINDFHILNILPLCDVEYCEKIYLRQQYDATKIKILEHLADVQGYKLTGDIKNMVKLESYKHNVFEILLIRSGEYPEIESEDMAYAFYDYTKRSKDKYMVPQWERLIMTSNDKYIHYLNKYAEKHIDSSMIDNAIISRMKMIFDTPKKRVITSTDYYSDGYDDIGYSRNENSESHGNAFTHGDYADNRNYIIGTPFGRLPSNSNDLVNFILENPRMNFSDDEKMTIMSKIDDQDMLDMVMSILYN